MGRGGEAYRGVLFIDLLSLFFIQLRTTGPAGVNKKRLYIMSSKFPAENLSPQYILTKSVIVPRTLIEVAEVI